MLVLTMFDDDQSIVAALRAGPSATSSRGAPAEAVARALEAVGRGEAIFGPPVAERLRPYVATHDIEAARPFPQLTQREREVLELLAQGCSNPDTTRRLVLSPKTVGNHVSNIFAKRGVPDRAQAIVAAREAGFGQR